MRSRSLPLALSGLLVLAACHHAAPGAPELLPDKLPFAFTRPAAGTPPTTAQVSAFTKTMTGFFQQVHYFTWATHLAHGLDASYDPRMPDYALWWGQVDAVKSGDTVTFSHWGTDDNMTIEMSKLFNGVAAGYLATGDPAMHRLVTGFAKGYAAFVMAMHWGDEAPGEYIWARAPFNHNHSYTTWDGLQAAVDYSPIESVAFDGNANTVPNNTNPYWGSIWVRNIRSQDDIPHIYRTVPWLLRLVQDAPDQDVKDAAAEALVYLEGFTNDVFAHGYTMRSKQWAQVFIPPGDLVSYTYYDSLVPHAECNATLATALIALQGTAGNDCGNGVSPIYEGFAEASHYYDEAIIRYFHLAALANALVNRQDDVALALMGGLATRVDSIPTDPNQAGVMSWNADYAAYLVAAGATGLPLTGAEAQVVEQQFAAAAQLYAAWPDWDLWSPSIPDGTYPYTPDANGPDGTVPSIQEVTLLFEYCESPWKNPASVDPVDCAQLLNPSSWE